MAKDLLFEIGTEEIPAGYIMPALQSFQEIMGRRLAELSLKFDSISGVGTPRRLAISVTGLTERQSDRREEVLGPPKAAAFNADGQPTKAAVGFAKSRGMNVEDIKIVSTAKGDYVMLPIEINGQDTSALLLDLLPEVATEIPFPKSMRWGTCKTGFARPIQWIVTLFGNEVIPCTIATLTAGNKTRGHRFHHPEWLTVSGFSQYVTALREAHVLVDPAERTAAVEKEITRAASEAGGQILPDQELLETVANLVEKPHAICGSFETRFLELPKEVLITSMREHQKYFAITDNQGKLMPNFIAVNNTRVKDVLLAAEGHQRVLRARLEDAFFFFNEDRATPLPERVNALNGVIFQAKLGTMLDKTDRVTALASFIAGKVAINLTEKITRAAHLSKADLLTSMVNEFPSLQGIIGREYALLNGEAKEVAEAIHEHYLPVRAGGELPRGLVGAVVGLADRLDTISGCFGIGQTPTGTADPFGLRRLALGVLHIIERHDLVLPLSECIAEALRLYGDRLTEDHQQVQARIIEFIKGRFVNDRIQRGIPVETVEAVTSIAFDDTIDCQKRVLALHEISRKPAFGLLAATFKRVMNIIKDVRPLAPNPALFVENAEKQLFAAYEEVNRKTAPLIVSRQYGEALEIILSMKGDIDIFFDDVMVMVEDEKIRGNRLALLAAIADLFLKVGDFSKMYALNQSG